MYLVPPARLAAGSDDVVEKEAADVCCFVCLLWYVPDQRCYKLDACASDLPGNSENPAGHSSHPP
jgi:hypothetical protein